MPEQGSTAKHVEEWLPKLLAGDAEAPNKLVEHFNNRLLKLAKKMFSRFEKLERWVAVEDVCQNASMRLRKALEDPKVRPKNAVEFLHLASQHIRWELHDMERHFFGPEGYGANYLSDPAKREVGQPALHEQVADGTGEPSSLPEWTEFHSAVGKLPDGEKEAFQLRFYQELTQKEAASLLKISEPTLRKRYQAARIRLGEALQAWRASRHS